MKTGSKYFDPEPLSPAHMLAITHRYPDEQNRFSKVNEYRETNKTELRWTDLRYTNTSSFNVPYSMFNILTSPEGVICLNIG